MPSQTRFPRLGSRISAANFHTAVAARRGTGGGPSPGPAAPRPGDRRWGSAQASSFGAPLRRAEADRLPGRCGGGRRRSRSRWRRRGRRSGRGRRGRGRPWPSMRSARRDREELRGSSHHMNGLRQVNRRWWFWKGFGGRGGRRNRQGRSKEGVNSPAGRAEGNLNSIY